MTVSALYQLRFVCVALAVALAAGACAPQGAGDLVGGPLVVDDCTRPGGLRRFDPFEMDFGFMALERDSDVVVMRFAPVPSLMPLDDSLTVTVDDFSVIAAEIATTGLTSRSQEDGLHVGLNLGESCPASTAPMTARFAHATFDALSADGGERVVFTLVFDLFDERLGKQVGWNLTARGDFEVKLGTPWQQFSDPSAQKH